MSRDYGWIILFASLILFVLLILWARRKAVKIELGLHGFWENLGTQRCSRCTGRLKVGYLVTNGRWVERGELQRSAIAHGKLGQPVVPALYCQVCKQGQFFVQPVKWGEKGTEAGTKRNQ